MTLPTTYQAGSPEHFYYLVTELQKYVKGDGGFAFQALEQPRAIDETFDDFLTYLKFEQGLRPHTVTNYTSDMRILKNFLEAKLNRPPLTTDFTAEHFRAFIAHLRSTGLHDVSVARRFQGLRRYSAFLVNRKLAFTVLDHNSLSIRFKRRDTISRYLTQNEFKRLLTEATLGANTLAVRNWALVNFLYYEYLSISKTLRLKQKDIDLMAGTVVVKPQVTRGLKPQTITVLQKFLPTPVDGDTPLFPSKNGRHLICHSYREKIVKPALSRVAPDFKPSSLHPRDWPSEIRNRLLISPEAFSV